MTTAISLFSGAVDGMAIAAQAAGFCVTHHVEWDAWCCRVLRMNHPDSVVINEDIKHVGNLPPVDLIFGGSPCQDFSVAGARAGFAGERYLWPEMFRIVRESKPYAVVHENVRGGVSAGLLDQICDDLESAGYETKAFVYPANVFGAPHERYRMFIVGLLADPSTHRRQKPGTIPNASENTERDTATPEQTWRTITDETVSGGETMEHAERSRLPEYHTANSKPYTGSIVGGFSTTTKSRIHEPRVGRDTHGTASRLHRLDAVADFPGFPAGQGSYQHPYEPPRTTAQKAHDAKQRVQALGNAVVWQQAYPIFAALMELFEKGGVL